MKERVVIGDLPEWLRHRKPPRRRVQRPAARALIRHVEQRDGGCRALLDDEYASEARQDVIDHFEEQSAARHFGGIAIFGQDRIEALGLAACAVHALRGVALGFGHDLLGLTLGTRHLLIAPLLGFVDQPLAFLLGLIHFVEGRLHEFRRRHVLKLDRADLNAHPERVEDLLQLDLRLRGDLDALLGEHVTAEIVPDDAAHHGLVDVADRRDRIAYAVQEFVGVSDAILHDPFDVDHLEIAGQHQRLVLLRARLLVAVALRSGSDRAKSELLLQDASGRHEIRPIDAERQLEMETGLANRHHPSEALDDRLTLGLNGVDRRPGTERQQGEDHQDRAEGSEIAEIEVGEPLFELLEVARSAGNLFHPVELLVQARGPLMLTRIRRNGGQDPDSHRTATP
jgi:hypothetical protein